MRQRIISGITGLAVVACAYQAHIPAGEAEVKGKWGKVVPIADDNHPNLYYNQSDVDGIQAI